MSASTSLSLDINQTPRSHANGHPPRSKKTRYEAYILQRNDLPKNLPLPTELRLEVFKHTLANSVDPPLYMQRCPIEFILPIPWMKTTHEIFAETLPLLFQHNEFRIMILAPTPPKRDPHSLHNPTILFKRKTLRWLKAQDLLQAPLLRDVSFGFSYGTTFTYGPKAGDDLFRLRSHRGRARISHHECVFCGSCDWIRGEGRGDVDVAHPSCTALLEDKYRKALHEHDVQLASLNEEMAGLVVHYAGLTFADIAGVMGVLHRRFPQGKCKRMPNVAKRHWVYRDPTKLSQHLFNCSLANKVVADLYHRRREHDREQERARRAAVDAIRDARDKRRAANDLFPYLVMIGFAVLGAVGCLVVAGLNVLFLSSMEEMMPWIVCLGPGLLVVVGAYLYNGLNDLFLWYYGHEI